ncbi:MFS transporter, FLVCR family, MFS-domain-containing protein 7, partial [Lecanoromycetidae sp. Uapishka_2]
MHEDPIESDPIDNEADHLLSDDDWMEMAELDREATLDTGGKDERSLVEGRYTDGEAFAEASGSRPIEDGDEIALANDGNWLSFSPVANTAADFFSTSPSIINWLSTAFLFAFVVATPATIWALHTGGPRLAIIISSALILAGNWIRYGGARSSPPSFGLTMFGQILIGFAQPFVLSAPTRYSDLWFTPAGRVSATAIASLANPFGGALGQLINPFLATKTSEIPNMTLYVAIISTVASLPSFFVPSKPPTPVSPSSTHTAPSLSETVRILSRNTTFYLVFIPFATYVGFFNSLSSLLTQVLTPYGFSEETSGIAGAVLILVGLVSAAITSPFVDRTKAYLPFIRVLAPIIAVSYLAFIWAPGTRTIAAPYVILAFVGAASFSLVPVALEWLVEVTWPVGPEASSTICWSGGQLLGGIFIVISDALKAGKDADPPFTMSKALVFEAVVAIAVVPCIFLLWRIGRVESRRLDVDKGRDGGDGGGDGGGR